MKPHPNPDESEHEPECPYRADDACFRCILVGKICDQAIDPLEEQFGEMIYHTDDEDEEDPGVNYSEAENVTKELDGLMKDFLNDTEYSIDA